MKSPAVKRALLVAAVIGFAFLAYSNSFNAGFLLDNDPIILKDARMYVRAPVLSGVATTAFPFGDNPLVGADFWTARMTAVKVIGRYVALLVWPARLSFDYSFNENPLFG